MVDTTLGSAVMTYFCRYDAWLPPNLVQEGDLDSYSEVERLLRTTHARDEWRGIARAARLLNEALERKRPWTSSRRTALLSLFFALAHNPDLPL